MWSVFSRGRRGQVSTGGGTTPTLDEVLTEGNDGGAQQIKNIADGTDPTDAVTLEQLDAVGTPTLSAVLSEGNDGGAQQIKNIADGTDPTDAVTLEQLDAVGTPTLSAVLSEGNDGGAQQIKNIADGTDPTDAVTLEQLDAVGTPTLSAVLSEGNDGGAQQIKNIADGTDPTDAVTLEQLTAVVSPIVASADLVAQNNAVADFCTYTNADGVPHTYTIYCYLNVTVTTGDNCPIIVDWTDENGIAQTTNLIGRAGMQTTFTNQFINNFYYNVLPLTIRVGAGGTINVSTTYSSFPNPVLYDIGAAIQFMD